MTLNPHDHVVERDRPFHHGKILATCPEEGAAFVAFDTDPVGTHWELEGFLTAVTP